MITAIKLVQAMSGTKLAKTQPPTMPPATQPKVNPLKAWTQPQHQNQPAQNQPAPLPSLAPHELHAAASSQSEPHIEAASMQLPREAMSDIYGAIANNPMAPKNALINLAKHPRVSHFNVIANHANADEDVLQTLASNPNDYGEHARRAVLGRRDAPAKVLHAMLTNPDLPPSASLVATVVRHANVAPATIQYLYDQSKLSPPHTVGAHQEHMYDSFLARNPKTPSHILEDIHNKGAINTEAIGSNQNTPEYILRQLAQHNHPHIRAAVARNLGLPLDVTTHLMNNDPDESVREAAKDGYQKLFSLF